MRLRLRGLRCGGEVGQVPVIIRERIVKNKDVKFKDIKFIFKPQGVSSLWLKYFIANENMKFSKMMKEIATFKRKLKEYVEFSNRWLCTGSEKFKGEIIEDY